MHKKCLNYLLLY